MQTIRQISIAAFLFGFSECAVSELTFISEFFSTILSHIESYNSSSVSVSKVQIFSIKDKTSSLPFFVTAETGRTLPSPVLKAAAILRTASFTRVLASLVALGRDDGERYALVIEIVDHGQIVARRIVADVCEREHVRNVLFFRKKSSSILPHLSFSALDTRAKPYPGKIRQQKLAEIKIIHQPRAPRVARGARQLVFVREHVDERTLAHVGFAAYGDHGLIGF